MAFNPLDQGTIVPSDDDRVPLRCGSTRDLFTSFKTIWDKFFPNRLSLNKIGESGGNPLWNGGTWPGGSGALNSVYVDNYAPIGDGSAHTLASQGYTLSSARAKWPNITISSTNQYVDWCALQQAIYIAENTKSKLYLGGKIYFTGASLSNHNPLIVQGCGKGFSSFGLTSHITTIMSDHQGVMWDSPNAGLQLNDLAFHFSGTPNSNQVGLLLGSDITGPNFYGLCRNVRFTNNYTGCKLMSDNFGGFEWCTFRNNTYCGLWIENDYSSDRNSGTINHCEFTDEGWTSTYLCYIKQGSLWFVTDNDFLRGQHQLYIDIPNPVIGTDTAETDFFINQNSFEDCYGYSLYIKDNRYPTYQTARVHIHDNETYNLRYHDVWYLDGIDEISITGNSLNSYRSGTVTTSANLKLRNISHGVIVGNTFAGADSAIDVDSTVTNVAVGTNQNSSSLYISGTGGTGFVLSGSTDIEALTLASGHVMQVTKDTSDGLPVARYYGFGISGGATSCNHQLNAARGTQTAPVAVNNYDVLGAFSFRGYAAGFPTYAQAIVLSRALETYTNTAQGSSIEFGTTPIGSASRSSLVTIDGAGNVVLSTAAAGFVTPNGDKLSTNISHQFTINGTVFTSGFANPMTTVGDIIYSTFNPSIPGPAPARLGAPPAGYVLTGVSTMISGYGPYVIPQWVASSASQWTTSGSDIYYTTGRVGIGIASTVANRLHVADSTDASANRGLLVSQHTADATNAVIFMHKSRGGSAAVPTAISTNDIVSGIVSKAFVGATNSYQTASQLLVTATGTITDAARGPGSDLSIKLADGSTGLVERFRIKSSGIVNILNTPSYANNAAAITGGLVVGDIYRNGDVLQIVH